MEIERLVVKLFADASQYNHALDAAVFRLGGVATRFAMIGGQVASGTMNPIVGAVALAGGAIQGMAVAAQLASVAIGTLVSTLGTLSVYALKVAADFEVMEVQFGVMLRSAESGTAMIGNIRRLAIETPFKARDLADTARTLLGMGVSANAIMPSLSRLGDIAGGDAERLRRLAYAAGQVSAAGRFMGTELRQFTEAGIGVADFADAVGMSTYRFQVAMREGQIGADAMWRGINALTNEGGRFYGMMDKMSQTIQGRWNALMETIELGAGRIGTALAKAFHVGDSLNAFTTWIMSIVPETDAMDEAFRKLTDYLSVAFEPVIAFLQVLVATIELNRDALLSWIPTALQVRNFLTQAIKFVLTQIEQWGPLLIGLEKTFRVVLVGIGLLAGSVAIAVAGIGVAVGELLTLGGLLGKNPMRGVFRALVDDLSVSLKAVNALGRGFDKAAQAGIDMAKAVRGGLEARKWQAASWSPSAGEKGGDGDFGPSKEDKEKKRKKDFADEARDYEDFVTSRVLAMQDRMRELRTAMATAPFEQRPEMRRQLKQMDQELTEFLDKHGTFKGKMFNPDDAKAGGKKENPEIPIPFVIPPDVREFALKLEKSLGSEAADKWMYNQEMLAESLRHGLLTPGQVELGQVDKFMDYLKAAPLQFRDSEDRLNMTQALVNQGWEDGLLGIKEGMEAVQDAFEKYATDVRNRSKFQDPLEAFQRELELINRNTQLTDMERALSVEQQFRKVADWVGTQKPVDAKANLVGSSGFLDTINRAETNAMTSKDMAAQMVDILRLANEKHDRLIVEAKGIYDALKDDKGQVRIKVGKDNN